MSWTFFVIKLALAGVVLGSTVLSPRQDETSSSKKFYVSTGYEVALSGSILLTCESPEPRIIDMSADPACYESNPNPRSEDVVVKNGRLANVFVYVKSSTVLDSYLFESPKSSVVIERNGCRYVPHVLGMRVGQPLTIVNNDPTYHNSHPTPRNNAEWNYTQPPGAPAVVKTFDRPETFIPFKDNQHPWEKGYVGVFSHPFFAVSDENGNYTIKGLPPGQYKIVAWHERFGEKTVDVTLVYGEERDLSFTFDATDH